MRESLSSFRWPEKWPERPESLTHDDLELATCAQKIERGEKLSREDSDQWKLLAAWRSAVFRLETQAGSRLRVLLGGIYTFEMEGCHEQGRELREFVRRQYRCNVPDPCLNPDYPEAKRFADHFGRNMGLFPLWLRAGVKPPEGKGFTRIAMPQRRFNYAPAEED